MQEESKVWKYILIGVLAIGILSAGVRVATLALFTSTASVAANTFSTGTVDIATSPTDTIITYTNMAPGDTVVGSLLVENTSALQLRYAISSSATSSTPELKDQLVLTIKTIDVTTPATPCDNFDGTLLYTGDMDSTAGKLVGDNAPGDDTGDRVLNAGGDETLCFKGELPLTTGNTYQGKSTTVTFTLTSERLSPAAMAPLLRRENPGVGLQ